MVCSGCTSVLSMAHPRRHLGEGNMPKKPHPQISHPTPPKMSDKHPRVQDPADSLSWFCSTRERLMIPPAPPRPWVKGISDNVVLAQPLWGRKGC